MKPSYTFENKHEQIQQWIDEENKRLELVEENIQLSKENEFLKFLLGTFLLDDDLDEDDFCECDCDEDIEIEINEDDLAEITINLILQKTTQDVLNEFNLLYDFGILELSDFDEFFEEKFRQKIIEILKELSFECE